MKRVVTAIYFVIEILRSSPMQGYSYTVCTHVV